MPPATKKMLILAILEILQKYTDADHRLRQADIIEKLVQDYGLSAARKAVGTNLTALQDAGYSITCDNGWYYEHTFCEAELNLLIDSVLFNGSIPHKQRADLVKRIRALGGQHYKPIIGSSMNKPVNPEFMLTYEVLHEAIARHRMVQFHYGAFDVDKQLHLRPDETGAPKLYTVSPYHVVQANGHNYLIANVSKYDKLTHFRLDRMLHIVITDEPARSIRSITGYENGMNVQNYLNAHLHMFSGKAQAYRLLCKRYMAGDILDWFGMDVRFTQVTEETFVAHIHSDERSLKFWLMMYGEHASLMDR